MAVVKIRFSLRLYWNLEDGEGHCVSLNAIQQTFQSAVTTPMAFLKRFNKTCSKFLPPKTHKRIENKRHIILHTKAVLDIADVSIQSFRMIA